MIKHIETSLDFQYEQIIQLAKFENVSNKPPRDEYIYLFWCQCKLLATYCKGNIWHR